MKMLPQLMTFDIVALAISGIEISDDHKIVTDFPFPEAKMISQCYVSEDEKHWYGITALGSLPDNFPHTPRGGVYLYCYGDLGIIDQVKSTVDAINTIDIYTSISRKDQLSTGALQSLGFELSPVRKVGRWKDSVLLVKWNTRLD
jgi:hypothetical protein